MAEITQDGIQGRHNNTDKRPKLDANCLDWLDMVKWCEHKETDGITSLYDQDIVGQFKVTVRSLFAITLNRFNDYVKERETEEELHLIQCLQ